MHTPRPYHIDTGQASWICDWCSQLCGPRLRCNCCRVQFFTQRENDIAAGAEPTCGTIGGSITAGSITAEAIAVTHPAGPILPVTDPAAEIIAAIYEPLGTHPSLLPAYETVPAGACVTCHTVPRYSGTQCLYCATLANLKIKAQFKPLPAPAARRPRPNALVLAILGVLTFYLTLLIAGMLS